MSDLIAVVTDTGCLEEGFYYDNNAREARAKKIATTPICAWFSSRSSCELWNAKMSQNNSLLSVTIVLDLVCQLILVLKLILQV